MVDFFQNKKIFQKIKYSVKKKMFVKKSVAHNLKKNIYMTGSTHQTHLSETERGKLSQIWGGNNKKKNM